MTIQLLLQQSFNALQLGSVYALIALGYTMVYGILTMINFAHGDIFTVSCYLALWFSSLFLAIWAGSPPALVFAATVVCAMLSTAAIAVIIERLAYKPLRQAPRVSAVITALGVGLLIENTMVAIPGIGPEPRVIPNLLPGTDLRIGSVTLSAAQLLTIVVSAIAMIILDTIVRKTRVGIAMRAISWDSRIVPLMGVPIDRIISITFALGAAVAAVGGTMFGMTYQMDPYMGIRIGWWAFISAVVGGIGNIRGAMLGGFVLGFVEILTPTVLRSSSYRDMVAFSLLLLLLVFRPTGILGRPAAQKI